MTGNEEALHLPERVSGLSAERASQDAGDLDEAVADLADLVTESLGLIEIARLRRAGHDVIGHDVDPDVTDVA